MQVRPRKSARSRPRVRIASRHPCKSARSRSRARIGNHRPYKVRPRAAPSSVRRRQLRKVVRHVASAHPNTPATSRPPHRNALPPRRFRPADSPDAPVPRPASPNRLGTLESAARRPAISESLTSRVAAPPRDRPSRNLRISHPPRRHLRTTRPTTAEPPTSRVAPATSRSPPAHLIPTTPRSPPQEAHPSREARPTTSPPKRNPPQPPVTRIRARRNQGPLAGGTPNFTMAQRADISGRRGPLRPELSTGVGVVHRWWGGRCGGGVDAVWLWGGPARMGGGVIGKRELLMIDLGVGLRIGVGGAGGSKIRPPGK